MATGPADVATSFLIVGSATSLREAGQESPRPRSDATAVAAVNGQVATRRFNLDAHGPRNAAPSRA